ncbi:MAG: hypothetical protein ACI93L_002535 [Cyclobacteriaceae bacterium]|jgi:hypothetical protein
MNEVRSFTRALLLRKKDDFIFFKNGTYNKKTGLSSTKKMELPFIIQKIKGLHKATTDSPLFFLNIFFVASLLFFVFSTFWMYTPKMPVFKKAVYFVAAGIAMNLVLAFI